jgi:hypothetical protein
MNCEIHEDTLISYALGQLDRRARQLIDEHLSCCVHCTQRLRDLQETLGCLPSNIDPVTPPERIKRQLLARIQKHQAAGRSDRWNTNFRRRLSRSVRLNVAATVGLALLSYLIIKAGMSWYQGHQARHLLSTRIGNAGDLFDLPQLRFVSLQSELTGEDVRAHLVWDESTREAHFFVAGLKPQAGLQCCVWLRSTDEKWLPPETLTFDNNGMATGVQEVQLPFQRIERVLITLGSTELSDVPAGRVVFSSLTAF